MSTATAFMLAQQNGPRVHAGHQSEIPLPSLHMHVHMHTHTHARTHTPQLHCMCKLHCLPLSSLPPSLLPSFLPSRPFPPSHTLCVSCCLTVCTADGASQAGQQGQGLAGPRAAQHSQPLQLVGCVDCLPRLQVRLCESIPAGI